VYVHTPTFIIVQIIKYTRLHWSGEMSRIKKGKKNLQRILVVKYVESLYFGDEEREE
jgi:hypothetical protein